MVSGRPSAKRYEPFAVFTELISDRFLVENLNASSFCRTFFRFYVKVWLTGKKHKNIFRSTGGCKERGTISHFLANSHTCARTVKHLPVLKGTEVLPGVNDRRQTKAHLCPSSLP